jgi:hypothetical protein
MIGQRPREDAAALHRSVASEAHRNGATMNIFGAAASISLGVLAIAAVSILVLGLVVLGIVLGAGALSRRREAAAVARDR